MGWNEGHKAKIRVHIYVDGQSDTGCGRPITDVWRKMELAEWLAKYPSDKSLQRRTCSRCLKTGVSDHG